MLGTGHFGEAVEMIQAYKKIGMKDSTLELLAVMCDIVRMEEQCLGETRFFAGQDGYQAVYEHYMKVRFLLRRMELGFAESEYIELENAIKKGKISYEAITTIMLHATLDKKRVLTELGRYYEESGQKENARKIREIYAKIENREVPTVYMRKIF